MFLAIYSLSFLHTLFMVSIVQGRAGADQTLSVMTNLINFNRKPPDNMVQWTHVIMRFFGKKYYSKKQLRVKFHASNDAIAFAP